VTENLFLKKVPPVANKTKTRGMVPPYAATERVFRFFRVSRIARMKAWGARGIAVVSAPLGLAWLRERRTVFPPGVSAPFDRGYDTNAALGLGKISAESLRRFERGGAKLKFPDSAKVIRK
jgi:hypothetical protein